MNINTKFTVATDEGTRVLDVLTKELAIEKFTHLLDKETLVDYISDRFNLKVLVDELNSMSNQWLVVYVDDIAAGYARITTQGKKIAILEGKRVVRIADFGVLEKYHSNEVMNSLLDKCIQVCRSYEGIWINEYIESPLISSFEAKGFVQQHEGDNQHDDLPLKSHYFVLFL
ncbi:GNAT family N-acetyltransferase [Sphingobacterium tabacisoli]|uniref:GNAT family N-acetyltransferase n=1 Tax=Sphingobacterium tabacisoli TaxID=2044855 RepID=A0ABW5L292_9SPHI|nr:GNAT family N-acetyltransferase [Sphingobacterium tabacisoli]